MAQAAAEKLRAELGALKLSALVRRARGVGVDEAGLEDALDGDAPAPSIVELIIAHHRRNMMYISSDCSERERAAGLLEKRRVMGQRERVGLPT